MARQYKKSKSLAPRMTLFDQLSQQAVSEVELPGEQRTFVDCGYPDRVFAEMKKSWKENQTKKRPNKQLLSEQVHFEDRVDGTGLPNTRPPEQTKVRVVVITDGEDENWNEELANRLNVINYVPKLKDVLVSIDGKEAYEVIRREFRPPFYFARIYAERIIDAKEAT